MTNPYLDLEDYCYYSRSMTRPAPGNLDPVVRSAIIGPEDKVATIGSCFAQHLARHIAKSGLNYYVSEEAPDGMDPVTAIDRNYGVFSARYGNVYTPAQAVQLFDRAFGHFLPADDVWAWKHGFVDAFRPRIEPVPFESAAHVRHAAAAHLEHVRAVFQNSDWLVFTLGLTEAFRSSIDGAIYPVAPGVAGGAYAADRYEFVNFSAAQVESDLAEFIGRLRSVNPRVRVLLTVSPVPLAATYERRHVWVSTTLSKAALRVAADAVEKRFADVIYFPSYEIITSPTTEGRYYADDLRQVTESGVQHVMRIFAKHFTQSGRQSGDLRPEPSLNLRPPPETDIVCDEEAIEAAIRAAGFRPTVP